MTEPLKFRENIASKTGGREAIMARARKSSIYGALDAKAATAAVLFAIKEQLHEPLVKLFEAHLANVEDEYELMEGPCPSGVEVDDGEIIQWWAGMYSATREAFAGDTVAMIGAAELEEWITSEESTEALVDLILAEPVEDPAHWLASCGITKEDIESLVVEDASVTSGAKPGETTASAAGVTSRERSPSDSDKIAFSGEEPEKTTASVAAPPTRKRSPSVTMSSATDAARAALQALIDHSSIKEQEIADALGVSRPQANNYRNGKTVWAPNEGQMMALSNLFSDATSKLSSAWETLTLEIAMIAME